MIPVNHNNSKLKNWKTVAKRIMNWSTRYSDVHWKMLGAENINALYDCLSGFCHCHLNTGILNIFLFSDIEPAFRQRNIYAEFRDSRLNRMFIELFNRNKPLCDSLQQEYIHMLFGRDENIESTLLIPVVTDEFTLLFALGSRQHNSYRQGFELKLVEFLVRMFVRQFSTMLAAAK
ncbi:MAG: DUF484 family protein [Thiotrichales bacterium]|nr:DUF484 family protein [Thiotrichales bacterium]